MRRKKYVGTVLAVLIIMALVAPSVWAQSASELSEYPATDVVITKVKLPNLTNFPVDHDGDAISSADWNSVFGLESGRISNITFTYWSITEDQYNTMKATPASYKTVEQVQTLVGTGEAGTVTAATNAEGEVTIPAMAAGYYWFIENTPTTVTDSAAVPFGIALPVGDNDPTTGLNGFKKVLYVYPKNIEAGPPEVEKDVTTVGNNEDTANAGADITWITYTSIPVGIGEYTQFDLTDTLNAALDYTGDLAVTLDGTEMVKDTGTAFDYNKAGVDYFATEPAVGSAGATVKIQFTKVGLQKLAAAHADGALIGDAKLQLTFTTAINETATPGQVIPNTVTLDYNNGHGVTGSDTPTTNPGVWTGGKLFDKLGVGTEAQGLAGAVFTLHVDVAGTTGVEMKWTQALLDSNADALAAGKFATAADGTATSESNLPQAGDTIYLLSSADGSFEFKGLQGQQVAADGITVTQDGTYALQEVKAPDGYVRMLEPFTFTVTKTSYTDAAMTIQNKKVAIPQTGGIGSVLFVLAGLVIVTTAYNLKKKRNAKDI